MRTAWTADPVQVTGFRLDQLASAFDRVRDSRDWQAPVQAEIDSADRPVTQQAVLWFTQTVPYFHPTPGSNGRLLVTAPGHRSGHAGDPSPGVIAGLPTADAAIAVGGPS